MARPKKDIEGIRKTFINSLANNYKIGSFGLGLSGFNEIAYVLLDDRDKPCKSEINGHIHPSNSDFFECIYGFDFDKLSKELGLKGLVFDLELKTGGEIQFIYPSAPHLEKKAKYVLLYLMMR